MEPLQCKLYDAINNFFSTEVSFRVITIFWFEETRTEAGCVVYNDAANN